MLGSDRRLSHVPALDGLRGVAVLLVLAFHALPKTVPGGYLGVSVFFTLSGYLIASLILAELDTEGRLDRRRFYVRRLRRLLPAQVLTILLVLLLLAIRVGGDSGGLAISQIPWAFSQLYNWHLLADGQSYLTIFEKPSLLNHFWSLAIEEQFYLLLPMALVAASVSRRWRYTLAGLAVILFAAPIMLRNTLSADVIYLSTPLRASELLAGVGLAFVQRRLPDHVRRLGSAPLSQLALPGTILLCLVTSDDSSAWPYRGLLPLFALVSVCMVSAGLVDHSLTSRVLSGRSLRYLGSRSYGIYLLHWPLFTLIDRSVGDMPLGPLLLLKGASTLLAAELSFRLVEHPIRSETWQPQTVSLAAGTCLAVLPLLLIAQPEWPQRTEVVTESDQIETRLAETVDLSPLPPSTSGGSVTSVDSLPSATSSTSWLEPVDQLPRVLLIGDSTAAALGAGLVRAAAEDGLGRIEVVASGACGVVRGGHFESEVLDSALQMTCPKLMWTDAPERVSEASPDLVVVLVTLADTWPRRWSEVDPWKLINDNEYFSRAVEDYAAYAQLLHGAGAQCVAFARPPLTFIETDSGREIENSFTNGSQVARMSVIQDLAASEDYVMELDLGQLFNTAGITESVEARPDGTHITESAATAFSATTLWPALDDLVSGLRSGGIGC